MKIIIATKETHLTQVKVHNNQKVILTKVRE